MLGGSELVVLQPRFLAHVDEFAADLDMEGSGAVAIHDALRNNMREWLTADAASWCLAFDISFGRCSVCLIVAPLRLGPLLLSDSPAITVAVLVLSSDLT